MSYLLKKMIETRAKEELDYKISQMLSIFNNFSDIGLDVKYYPGKKIIELTFDRELKKYEHTMINMMLPSIYGSGYRVTMRVEK